MSVDIVTLGEPLYELNQQADGRFLPGFGGDTMNVAVAAQRLGASSAMITKLGSDPFGDQIEALLRREQVDIGAVSRHPTAPTGIYLVTHGPDGHDFSYYRKGSAASVMAATDVPEPLVASAKYLHVSGISQAISDTALGAVDRAIERARRAGVPLSYDTNLRTRLWSVAAARPVVDRTARQARFLKTSLEDSAALLGLSDPSRIAAHFLGLGCEIVVVTLGKAGVHLAQANTTGASGQETIAGFRVEAVDATGAGDAFTGAFLAELVAGRSPAQAARFANAAAALSTLGYGAIEPLPRRADVERFLKQT
jgi:2-dehydro-3-deoxygluconokinase